MTASAEQRGWKVEICASCPPCAAPWRSAATGPPPGSPPRGAGARRSWTSPLYQNALLGLNRARPPPPPAPPPTSRTRRAAPHHDLWCGSSSSSSSSAMDSMLLRASATHPPSPSHSSSSATPAALRVLGAHEPLVFVAHSPPVLDAAAAGQHGARPQDPQVLGRVRLAQLSSPTWHLGAPHRACCVPTGRFVALLLRPPPPRPFTPGGGPPRRAASCTLLTVDGAPSARRAACNALRHRLAAAYACGGRCSG